MTTRRNKTRFMVSRCIYRAKRGKAYDPDNRKYDCYRPAQDGAYDVLDCWVCDRNGNVHPGYIVSPVPVSQGSYWRNRKHSGG